jgi:hypothetical protein
MVKLVFIAETVSEIEQIKLCLLDDVLHISYCPYKHKISYLEKIISSQIIKDNRISNVAWIFHSPSENLDQEIHLFADVVISKSNRRAVNKVIKLFQKVEAVIDSDTPRFDLMACCLLKNPQFKYIKQIMAKKMKGSKLEIAASDDLSGSMYYGKERDWILESHQIDLVGLYFSKEIYNYQFTLKGNPIENIRNNIGDAVISASSGDWKGAIDSMGSAILMAPIRFPIVDGCSKLYEVLKDPAVQTIFDSIPGLNIISFSVRMGDFVAKAAKGEASDWDIAFAVLDSVSLVAGFAVPGGSMSSSTIKSGVRSVSNISKVKNLARGSCELLQYSKDVGEIVQTLVENPNEKSIDDVAIQMAKIAVSAKISKNKMSDQLKVGAQTASATSFYAIKEVSNRAEREYDRISAEMSAKPSIIMYDNVNCTGSQCEVKPGMSITNLGEFASKAKSIRIPPRTAVKCWYSSNYNGTSFDLCNWNWFDMNINDLAGKSIGSILCVSINSDGSFSWKV